jgi:ribose transport system substrate-binding protein
LWLTGFFYSDYSGIMTAINGKYLTVLLLVSCFIGEAMAQENPMQFLSRANAKVAKAAALKSKWEGPVDGPKLQKNKKIVFIASNMADAGNAGLYAGMKEATAGSGWELLFIDCRGQCQSPNMVSQALDMKAAGIVLAGVDAASQLKGITAANVAKVPVVGWHANAKAGAVEGMFTNVTTNPKESAQIAALFGAVESNTKAGIVVFADSSNPYMTAKSSAILEVIKQCESCRLLSVEEMPSFEAYKKMLPTVETLVKKHGTKWTHVIAVNDMYFDVMEKPEIAAVLENNKLQGISAGDGSAMAYKRIRSNVMQIGTVPEPLSLHGWQVVDELNRAFSGVAASGFVTQVHLVTNQNIAYDGGTKNTFDPANDFRGHYQRYWAK